MRDRNRKMNKRITIIIATDFFCWVPFIIISAVHSLEIVDTTSWYSLLSLVILPINSVINPFLYDDTITAPLCVVFQFISTRTISLVRLKSRTTCTRSEIIEMEQRQVHGVASISDYRGPTKGLGMSEREHKKPNLNSSCSGK